MTTTGERVFAPRPGGAPLPRMLAAQTGLELRLLLRNGEQLLLALVIPVLVLVGVTLVHAVELGAGRRIDIVTPGVFALAVMSTAFTGQAIATGFDRRYGVLKRLGATPLPRWGLIAGKTACVLVIEAGQVAILAVVALALGWHPHGSVLDVLVLLAVGTAAFSGLGLLMAGTLRAEATLAAANLVWLLLLAGGGIVVPLDRLPDGVAAGLSVLPSAALTEGLRAVLQHGAGLPLGHLVVLLAWAVAGIAAASVTFRWE
jgi:ABC-2 type transport system permease protein